MLSFQIGSYIVSTLGGGLFLSGSVAKTVVFSSTPLIENIGTVFAVLGYASPLRKAREKRHVSQNYFHRKGKTKQNKPKKKKPSSPDPTPFSSVTTPGFNKTWRPDCLCFPGVVIYHHCGLLTILSLIQMSLHYHPQRCYLLLLWICFHRLQLVQKISVPRPCFHRLIQAFQLLAWLQRRLTNNPKGKKLNCKFKINCVCLCRILWMFFFRWIELKISNSGEQSFNSYHICLSIRFI